MKIKVIAEYEDYDNGKIIYSIKIEDDYDLIVLMEKLKNIEVIRIINLTPIELVIENTNYVNRLFKIKSIKNVKFINEPIKIIEIEGENKKVEIKSNVEFKITIPDIFYSEIDKINKIDL